MKHPIPQRIPMLCGAWLVCLAMAGCAQLAGPGAGVTPATAFAEAGSACAPGRVVVCQVDLPSRARAARPEDCACAALPLLR